MASEKRNDDAINVSSVSSGAIYRPLHIERSVKVYPIQEHELQTISTFNDQMTVWSSIGTCAVGLLLSCGWDLANLPEGESFPSAAKAFSLGCAIVASVSVYLVWRYKKNREGVLEKILNETTQPDS